MIICKGMHSLPNKQLKAYYIVTIQYKQNGAKCRLWGMVLGWGSMGSRRSLSRFMFGVAFLIWMAAASLTSL